MQSKRHLLQKAPGVWMDCLIISAHIEEQWCEDTSFKFWAAIFLSTPSAVFDIEVHEKTPPVW